MTPGCREDAQGREWVHWWVWKFHWGQLSLGPGGALEDSAEWGSWVPIDWFLPVTGLGPLMGREGNGTPLQCSCRESPRDGGVWWAAVYGVAQSRTRLKRLSSSSMGILRVPWTARASDWSILKEISLERSLKGLMLKLKLQYFGHLMWRTDSFEKTLMLGKIEGRRRREDRGWDGWMASPTPWTWVWVNSGSWQWTGRTGVVQSMGSQRAGHDWATELNWADGGIQVALVVKNLPANAGNVKDSGSIPGSGRSPGEENGMPLQYSCLENAMDRGAWWAIVLTVAKSWARLKQLSPTYGNIHFPLCLLCMWAMHAPLPKNTLRPNFLSAKAFHVYLSAKGLRSELLLSLGSR